MTTTGRFWDRLSDELKTASDRARKEAERAVRTGVLQMDLVSLRRDRQRTRAMLGERVLELWSGDKLETVVSDSETLRLKDVVQSIELLINAKEQELRTVRARTVESAAPAAS
jgi:hypothetical protein